MLWNVFTTRSINAPINFTMNKLQFKLNRDWYIRQSETLFSLYPLQDNDGHVQGPAAAQPDGVWSPGPDRHGQQAAVWLQWEQWQIRGHRRQPGTLHHPLYDQVLQHYADIRTLTLTLKWHKCAPGMIRCMFCSTFCICNLLINGYKYLT